MDCPHCGAENLLGARMCAACGANMLSAPPPKWVAGDATLTQAPFSEMPTESKLPRIAEEMLGVPAPPPEPAPEPAEGAPVQSVCRVCWQGFDRRAEEEGAPICPDCSQFAPTEGGDAGSNDVQLHPATQEQEGVDIRAGGAIKKRSASVRRSSLRVGPIVAVSCLAVCLACLAVVTWVRREKDPAADYMDSVKREEGSFVVAPSKASAVHLESTLNVTLVHELVRASFSSRLEEVLNLQQRSVQTCDVAWARDDARGVVLDSAVACRVALQTGTDGGDDGRESKVYPWEGYVERTQLIVPPGSGAQRTDGEPTIPGRDVTPCLTVHDIGAPSGAVAPGATWKAPVTLPFLMGRNGGLRNAQFPCDVTYHGRIVQNGVHCHLFVLAGSAPARIAEVVEDMNRSAGNVRGVLFFEAKTGLLFQARITGEASAWLEKGRVEDRVHVEGTLEIARK